MCFFRAYAPGVVRELLSRQPDLVGEFMHQDHHSSPERSGIVDWIALWPFMANGVRGLGVKHSISVYGKPGDCPRVFLGSSEA